ncbi:hypothetical protein V8C34DRAFT_211296 [Trichoderma compactum]
MDRDFVTFFLSHHSFKSTTTSVQHQHSDRQLVRRASQFWARNRCLDRLRTSNNLAVVDPRRLRRAALASKLYRGEDTSDPHVHLTAEHGMNKIANRSLVLMSNGRCLLPPSSISCQLSHFALSGPLDVPSRQRILAPRILRVRVLYYDWIHPHRTSHGGGRFAFVLPSTEDVGQNFVKLEESFAFCGPLYFGFPPSGLLLSCGQPFKRILISFAGSFANQEGQGSRMGATFCAPSHITLAKSRLCGEPFHHTSAEHNSTVGL